MIDKVVADVDEAIRDVGDGASILLGGFGLCGIPENLIRALVRRGTKNLTLISNNVGTDRHGIGLLLEGRQVDRMIASYVGENDLFERQLMAGILKLDLIPQGTLVERIRAGGAGLPAFFTPTGYGTPVAEGKETRIIEGRGCILENALAADFAFIRAHRGDRAGNLIYRGTARNFNPIMATAAGVTIAEVEGLVEPGELDPDQVHTPGIFVDRLLKGRRYDRPIEP